MKNSFKILSVAVIISLFMGLFFACSKDDLVVDNKKNSYGNALGTKSVVDPASVDEFSLEGKLNDMKTMVITNWENIEIETENYEIQFDNREYFEAVNQIFNLVMTQDIQENSWQLFDMFVAIVQTLPNRHWVGDVPEVDMIFQSYSESLDHIIDLRGNEANPFRLNQFYMYEVENMEFLDSHVKEIVLYRLQFVSDLLAMTTTYVPIGDIDRPGGVYMVDDCDHHPVLCCAYRRALHKFEIRNELGDFLYILDENYLELILTCIYERYVDEREDIDVEGPADILGWTWQDVQEYLIH